ncbi:Phage integrase family protein [Dokdonia pacifica]|uniref:Phage integrase family protein n=2 Tax=Dokdonia pacifica TaxID=1627892 RepID=A0A239AH27_9FLAO|nr:Phage integrase family protein [Dokdonia pacifica]
MSLHNNKGHRKYLNQVERLRFLKETKTCRTDIKLFCQLLYYTGARIAEIHNLTSENIDFANKTVVLETLKRRRKGIYREIPLPAYLLNDLHKFVDSYKSSQNSSRLFSFSLRTASRYLKSVMLNAKITGVRSCARGLRHGFAVHAVNKAPLTLVKKWLGHATLETTEIYLNVIGAEEREIAKKIW